MNPGTLEPMTAEELAPVFCDELIQQELDDTTAYFPIPEEILDFLQDVSSVTSCACVLILEKTARNTG